MSFYALRRLAYMPINTIFELGSTRLLVRWLHVSECKKKMNFTGTNRKKHEKATKLEFHHDVKKSSPRHNKHNQLLFPKTRMSFAIDTLSNPDGSASCTLYGYTVIASVNGPIEVSRRDELPEEAALEVNLRAGVGIGCKYSAFLSPLTLLLMEIQLQRTDISSLYSKQRSRAFYAVNNFLVRSSSSRCKS
jgi:hypothetical protein